MSGTAELAAVERAADLYRSLGDSRGLYLAACHAVVIAANIGDDVASEQWLREAALLHDAGWPPASRYYLLRARCDLAYCNRRYEEAEAAIDEVFRLATTLGDQQLMRVALGNQAVLSSARGDLAQAVERGRALLALLPRDQFGMRNVFALVNYAAALTEFGLLDEALSLMRQSAPILTRQGTFWMWLDTIALLAFKRGRIPEAALVLGRSDASRAKVGMWRDDPIDQRIRDGLQNCLRQSMPAAELERLLADGAAMSDEEAARGALAD